MIALMININQQKLAGIFTDIEHHKTVAEIIQFHSTNKLDVRNVALDGIQLQNTRNVLDIGCAFGFFTRALKGRLFPGTNILGIDLCVKYKTSFLESCKIAGLQGNFFGLDKKTINIIPSESVDLVICSYALYFFPEIIPEISRILDPSGTFVIITHSDNHLEEFITFLREALVSQGIQSPEIFPGQTLINNFNNNNGYQLLSPWFGRVKEKKYSNTLRFKFSNFEDLEKYFRFKQPYYIPDYLDKKNMIFKKIISRLHEHLQSMNTFCITKDDTIFVCEKPLYFN